jgi:hypothetical protein
MLRICYLPRMIVAPTLRRAHPPAELGDFPPRSSSVTPSPLASAPSAPPARTPSSSSTPAFQPRLNPPFCRLLSPTSSAPPLPEMLGHDHPAPVLHRSERIIAADGSCSVRKHLGIRVTPMRWISTIYLASSTASWQAPAGTQVSRLASHVLNNPPSFVYPRCVRCAPLSYTCFVCSEWLAQTWLNITATTYNRQQWDDERCSWMTGCSNQSAPSSTLQRLSAWTNERHVFVCEQVSPLRMTYVLL